MEKSIDALHRPSRSGLLTAFVLLTSFSFMAIDIGNLFEVDAVMIWLSWAVSVLLVMTVGRRISKFSGATLHAWRALHLGMILWILGDLFYEIAALVWDDTPTFSVVDVAYLSAYPCFAVGIVRLIRLRSESTNREGIIDGLAVTVASAMASWQLLIEPNWGPSMSSIERTIIAAYPFVDVLLLAVLCWLAFTPGHKNRSLHLLLMFGAAILALDLLYAVGSITGNDLLVSVSGWLYPIGYLFLTLSSEHPQVLDVAETETEDVHRTNPARFVLLGLTLFSASGLMLLRSSMTLGDSIFGLVGSGSITALVITRFVMLVRERESMEEAAAHRALHDELTGLANRELLLRNIKAERQRQQQTDRPFALMFIDLDRFKGVNDTWGHAAGDRVIVAAGNAIKNSVRSSDVVARVGGDEFAVLCKDLVDAAIVRDIAQRIVDRLSAELPREAKFVAASLGLALVEPNGVLMVDPEEVLHHADVAMYHAKRSGGRTWREFDAELRFWTTNQRDLEVDLIDALERNEFRLEYQPIVDIVNSRCVGFEALLRWDRPGHEPIGPTDFIPLAESTGLIVPIGEWVLSEASKFASQLTAGYITVNVSAIQLKQDGVAKAFKRAVQESGVDPKRLVLELTESALVTEVEHVNEILEELVELGPRIAVDDFGTGYSSLAYIDKFPVSIVKVDRTLIERIDSDESQRGVVLAISRLASTLGFSIVVEGIERESQRAALQELGVAYGQGWLFSRSLRPEAALEFMATHGKSGDDPIRKGAHTETGVLVIEL